MRNVIKVVTLGNLSDSRKVPLYEKINPCEINVKGGRILEFICTELSQDFPVDTNGLGRFAWGSREGRGCTTFRSGL